MLSSPARRQLVTQVYSANSRSAYRRQRRGGSGKHLLQTGDISTSLSVLRFVLLQLQPFLLDFCILKRERLENHNGYRRGLPTTRTYCSGFAFLKCQQLFLYLFLDIRVLKITKPGRQYCLNPMIKRKGVTNFADTLLGILELGSSGKLESHRR